MASMKTTMVIPSYWRRPSGAGIRETDAVYDHPTPLDEAGTLGRTIESIATLRDRDFDLVIIAASTAADVETQVEERVARIIKTSTAPVPVRLFSHSHLRQIHRILDDRGGGRFSKLLSLRGYSNIRNLCLFLPHLLGSDTAVLIDDDEVFEDPRFMAKAREYIGQSSGGPFIGAVAGYYLQPDGDWRLKKTEESRPTAWNKVARMNEAFEGIIGTPPRLKETPFVFGGNMIVHRDIFREIPFDPAIARGEDIDYLINMRMFGHTFFLDNTLSIKHLPPPKPHPLWKGLREDIYRFTRERAKLRTQERMPGMVPVRAEELDPYPGAFLKDDLEDMIAAECTALAAQYRKEGKEGDAAEALKNIDIAASEAESGGDLFHHLIATQGLWKEMMAFTAEDEIRERLAHLL